jgi:hypothetical protein
MEGQYLQYTLKRKGVGGLDWVADQDMVQPWSAKQLLILKV